MLSFLLYWFSHSNVFLFAECDEFHPCQGLGEHAHFRSFGMAFLTLFRIATGDNWNGIMKDTLREECEDGDDCLRNCCVSPYFAPLFFVVFVLMAQFVLVNVVVAVLMKHLEESHKQVLLQICKCDISSRDHALLQEHSQVVLLKNSTILVEQPRNHIRSLSTYF